MIYMFISLVHDAPVRDLTFARFSSLGNVKKYPKSDIVLSSEKRDDDDCIDSDWDVFSLILMDFLASDETFLAFIYCDTLKQEEKVIDFLKAIQNPRLSKIDLFQFSYATTNCKIQRPVFSHRGFTGDLGRLIGRNLARYDIIYKLWIESTFSFFYIFGCLTIFATKINFMSLPRRIIRNFLHGLLIFYIKKVQRFDPNLKVVNSPIQHTFEKGKDKSVLPRNRVRRYAPKNRNLGIILEKLLSRGPVIFAKNERELRRMLGVKSPLIYHSFESGTDGFILSKRFAKQCLSINRPPLLGLNQFLSASARTQNLVSIRLLRKMY